MKILIRQGRVVDPSHKRDGVFDILTEGPKIADIAASIKTPADISIDARGMLVVPGCIDLHVHLRQPGREDIETVRSGTKAAIAGGVTSVFAMPNTQPPVDHEKTVTQLQRIIDSDALANVFIIGAITKERRGEVLVDMKRMKKAGVAALSDDGNSIQDKEIMSDALKKAGETGLLIIAHCEDKALSKQGVINEGITATTLGLRGIPKRSEYGIVERDIKLAHKMKARVHIAHVSCKESVDIIRKAKKSGIPVTAETAPHYFSLDERCSATYDTNTKMNPPLRSPEDVEAIIKGLADGTIDAIASDHAPHGRHEKDIEFEFAAFGIIGLETMVPLSLMQLVRSNRISLTRLVELLATNPASIGGLGSKGSLAAGKDADITIIDPEKEWVYSKDIIQSKSRNSPFIDWRMTGRVRDVIVGGRPAMREYRIA